MPSTASRVERAQAAAPRDEKPWLAMLKRHREERRALVLGTLQATDGNRYRAAKLLGMHRNNLYQLLAHIDPALIPPSQHGGFRWDSDSARGKELQRASARRANGSRA